MLRKQSKPLKVNILRVAFIDVSAAGRWLSRRRGQEQRRDVRQDLADDTGQAYHRRVHRPPIAWLVTVIASQHVHPPEEERKGKLTFHRSNTKKCLQRCKRLGWAASRVSRVEWASMLSVAGSADCGVAEKLQAANHGALCPSHTQQSALRRS